MTGFIIVLCNVISMFHFYHHSVPPTFLFFFFLFVFIFLQNSVISQLYRGHGTRVYILCLRFQYRMHADYENLAFENTERAMHRHSYAILCGFVSTLRR